MTIYTCPACLMKRELDVHFGGQGVPACPSCRAPMRLEKQEPTGLIPGLAQGLAKLDRQESP